LSFTSKEEDDARVAGLLRTHFRDVWRIVRRFGVPEHCADDATQEVFIIASRRLADIVPGSERPFLLASAVRVAANLRRSLGARRECPEDDSQPEGIDPRPNAEALLDQKRLRQMLDGVLDELSDDLRVAFVLYELEGMSSPEIGELLGIPVGTVASRLRRAREAFELGVTKLKARTRTTEGV
jgi:RNA polymerase sigma-70 factor (ECF subfamily)